LASNKNQHFVPRCHLRSFSLDEAGLAINLYNIDRSRFIERAAVRRQRSGDYFYGKDPLLEKAIRTTEDAYGSALLKIFGAGYVLSESHGNLLKTFWLLQHLRTEAASRRSVEMSDEIRADMDASGALYRLEIREAVQIAMKTFAQSMGVVSDLKGCMVRNCSDTPFVTSDDPAVLTNRWYPCSPKTKGSSFGLQASGDVLLLPLSPTVLFIAYDNGL